MSPPDRPDCPFSHIPNAETARAIREADAETEARRAMRPALRRAADAAWEHGQDGLRYLADQSRQTSLHEFTLVLPDSGSLDWDVQDALLDAMPDLKVTLNARDGRTYLSFSREAPTLDEAIGSAIRDVARCGFAAELEGGSS